MPSTVLEYGFIRRASMKLTFYDFPWKDRNSIVVVVVVVVKKVLQF